MTFAEWMLLGKGLYICVAPLKATGYKRFDKRELAKSTRRVCTLR
jgi:hypothetical protein